MKGETIYKLQLYYKDEYIRLFQGDCLEVMDKLIEKEVEFDAIITDPPYGTTQCKWDSIIPFDSMWERLEKLIKDNGAICIFGSQPFTSILNSSNLKLFRYELIWEKNKPSNFMLANKQPMKYHENISIFYKKQPTYNKQMIERSESGKQRTKYKTSRTESEHYYLPKKEIDYNPDLKNPSSIIKINCEYQNTNLHPTQKPVKLCEWLVNTYTNENELILDFTCGSGTTLLASRNLKRKCIGIELEEKYCEIAKNRLVA